MRRRLRISCALAAAVVGLTGCQMITDPKGDEESLHDPHRGAAAVAKAVGRDPIYELEVYTSERKISSIHAIVERKGKFVDLVWYQGNRAEEKEDFGVFRYRMDSSPLRVDEATIDQMVADGIKVEGNARAHVIHTALPNGKILRSAVGNEGTDFSLDGVALWPGMKEADALKAAHDATVAAGIPTQWSWFNLRPGKPGDKSRSDLRLTVVTSWKAHGVDRDECGMSLNFDRSYGATATCSGGPKDHFVDAGTLRPEVFRTLLTKGEPTDQITLQVLGSGEAQWLVGKRRFDTRGKPIQ